jgi:hypothetical protein
MLKPSAMKRLPALSTAHTAGVAGEIIGAAATAGDGRDDALGRHLANAIVASIGDEEVARPVNATALGLVRWALLAAPPSPLKPSVPLPRQL